MSRRRYVDCSRPGCDGQARLPSHYCGNCRSALNARHYKEKKSQPGWWEERKRVMREQATVRRKQARLKPENTP